MRKTIGGRERERQVEREINWRRGESEEKKQIVEREAYGGRETDEEGSERWTEGKRDGVEREKERQMEGESERLARREKDKDVQGEKEKGERREGRDEEIDGGRERRGK